MIDLQQLKILDISEENEIVHIPLFRQFAIFLLHANLVRLCNVDITDQERQDAKTRFSIKRFFEFR